MMGLLICLGKESPPKDADASDAVDASHQVYEESGQRYRIVEGGLLDSSGVLIRRGSFGCIERHWRDVVFGGSVRWMKYKMRKETLQTRA
ncbi:hypothetical protein HZB90_03260 [archaeon]|nr:hypothetical protein [archaeon]